MTKSEEWPGTTIGAILRRAKLDEAAAWRAIDSAAERVAPRLARERHVDEATRADAIRDALVVAVADGFAALRRAQPDTPLDAWMYVTARSLLQHYVRSERRGKRRSLDEGAAAAIGDATEEEAADVATGASATDRVGELLSLLTPEQRRVEDALLVARSERAAAARLGTSRDHVHDVKRRAERRMRSGHKWSADADDRAWAVAAAVRAAARGDLISARLFQMYAEGRTQREIATAVGVGADAVRGRIARARRQGNCVARARPPMLVTPPNAK